VPVDDAVEIAEEELAVEVVRIDGVVGVATRDHVVARIWEAEAERAGHAVKLGERTSRYLQFGGVVAVSAHLAWRLQTGMRQCKI
jgi:hypothetical protein